jgi:hypothetical protein
MFVGVSDAGFQTRMAMMRVRSGAAVPLAVRV